MDTTYFGRKYWYMIFRARFPKLKKGKNLLWYKVKYETNDKYREWFNFLKRKWRNIIWIVCDGRQWLLWWFGDIPTQMCIYHMRQILTRYLTRKPKLEQNKSLKVIWTCIWEYPKEDIELSLKVWYTENKERLNEKNDNWNYIHTRTRKTYRSITKKLRYCYIFKEYPVLWIPNTNNSLESINWHLKTKKWIHRWLWEENSDKFIDFYLYYS
jgi:hypothetical protein